MKTISIAEHRGMFRKAVRDGHIDGMPKVVPTVSIVEAFESGDGDALARACAKSPRWGQLTTSNARFYVESYLSLVRDLAKVYGGGVDS